MKMALAEGCVEPSEIDYINAHGTSTPAGDKIETVAVKQVFGIGPIVNAAHKAQYPVCSYGCAPVRNDINRPDKIPFDDLISLHGTKVGQQVMPEHIFIIPP